MKNIAILIPTLKAGGAEKQAVLLASLLSKVYNVHLVLLSADSYVTFQNNLDIIEAADIKVHSLNGGIVNKFKKLKWILKENNIEVLFNYLTKPNVIGAIAGRLVGVKLIYNGIRNSRIDWWKLILEWLSHNLCATASIYNCYSGKEYFSRMGLNRKKAIVITNGFPDIEEAILREDKEIKHIVTVGRFVPQKDYKTIIKTIAYLKNVRKDFVMDIIGYGDEEQNIRNWIKEYGVEDCVNIYIRPDNVQDIVRDADIYLSASLFEGTSNSIMEALNWSLPVVATNVGDNEYLVKDGQNGYIHKTGDIEGLAMSVDSLLDSLELRNKFGYVGNKNLRDNYSTEIFEERYLKLIEG